MRTITLAVTIAVLALMPAACGPGDERKPDATLKRIHVDRTHLRDADGRYLYVNGVNLSGSDKIPNEDGPGKDPRRVEVTFTQRPFPIEEADRWFEKIRGLGFNSIRLVVTWEAVEHEGFRKYDFEFLDYIDQLVGKAGEHGVYVLVNFHENLYSRFLYSRHNRNPSYGEPGSLENMLAKVFPDEAELKKGRVRFDGRIGGDGAPRWAVEAALPEKKIDSPHWGMFKVLGNLGGEYQSFLIETIESLIGSVDVGSISLAVAPKAAATDDREIGTWLEDMVTSMRYDVREPAVPFDVTETCDVFPLTGWWENNIISYDIGRGYAAFYAGDSVFPSYTFVVDGVEVSVKDYLQEGYAGSWAQVARRMAKHDNVIGYDLVNEPAGSFLVPAVLAAYMQSDFDTAIVEDLVGQIAGKQLAKDLTRALFLLNIVPLFPARSFFEEKYVRDHKSDCRCTLDGDPAEKRCYQGGMTEEQTAACEAAYVAAKAAEIDAIIVEKKKKMREDYRADDINALSALMLNFDFTSSLVGLYDRVSQRILAEHPGAIIWLESGEGALDALLGGAVGTVNIWKPPVITQMVYTPHWYPDIYPFLGILSPPREFDLEEWIVNDFSDDLKAPMESMKDSFGPVPVVFGEFGTYFNYGGIEESRANGYRISSQILDNYYEGFEKLFAGRMLWDFSVHNTYEEGDQWNYEDFSVLGPKDAGYPVRSELAFSRPAPWFLAGKPREMRFYSDFHYYDPQKGVPDPRREFYLSHEGKETDAPTVIYVPRVQYPDGFYVWLSDGWAQYDDATQALYWHPTKDEPGWIHEVTIRPPQIADGVGVEQRGWSYYFDGDRFITGARK